MDLLFTSQFPVCPYSASDNTKSSLSACHCLTTSCHDLPLSPTGHDLVEIASVTSYFHAEDQVKLYVGEASLEYLRDVAQEAAEYLSANRDQLGPQSYLEVLKRFSTLAQAADEELLAVGIDCKEEDVQLRESLGDEAGCLRQLDEKITQAIANMDYPQQWKNTDSQPREGNDIGSRSVSDEL